MGQNYLIGTEIHPHFLFIPSRQSFDAVSWAVRKDIWSVGSCASTIPRSLLFVVQAPA